MSGYNKLARQQHEAVLRNGAKEDLNRHTNKAELAASLKEKLAVAQERLENAIKAQDAKKIAKEQDIITNIQHTLKTLEK